MKMQKAFNILKSNALWLFFFVYAIVISCSTPSKIKHKGAYIEIPTKEVSVGALKKDTEKHVYYVTIVNSGDTPLLISEITSSCYCAEAELPHEPIQPGDTYQLKVVLDVSEMALQNPFIREFYIESNATNSKESIITLTGSIIK